MKVLIKGPFLGTFILIAENMVFLSIKEEGYGCWCPFHSINMKSLRQVISKHAPGFLGTAHAIVSSCMYGSKKRIGEVTYIFHDIYFSTMWPSSIFPFCRQHPYGGPHAFSFRNFSFYLKTSILP